MTSRRKRVVVHAERPIGICMSIGVSLFLIAIGAILKYAVTTTIAGIDVQTAGLILMIVGILGLILSLFLWTSSRSAPAPPP